MTTNSKKSKNSKASKSAAKTTKVTTSEKTVKAPAVAAAVQVAAPVATPAKLELKTTTKAPVAKTETLVKTDAVKVETVKTLAPKAETLKTDTVVKTVSRGELEQLVRREAFKRAQLRQFRGGSPVNDWFAAEATVKAHLTARGFALN